MYFVRLIFAQAMLSENILTLKYSRFTVLEGMVFISDFICLRFFFSIYRVSLSLLLKVMLLCLPKRKRCPPTIPTPSLHPLLPYSQFIELNTPSSVLLFVQILFDGRLSNIIVFSYNAKAVDGQLCLEASPNENQTFFAHSPHATLLEVRVIIITIIIRS